jgi:hypothetical protein
MAVAKYVAGVLGEHEARSAQRPRPLRDALAKMGTENGSSGYADTTPTRLGRGQLRRAMQHLMNEMSPSTESADMHVIRIAWSVKHQ